MSVIRFELKEEHIKLLKHLRWSLLYDKFIVSAEDIVEDTAPFGCDDIYEGIDLILNGKPASVNSSPEHLTQGYSKEQKLEWDKLYSELPIALDVILYNGHFNLGIYKTRFHDRDWKQITT